MEKKFTIKVISDACGVLPHTLRVWEQRYQVFTPERTEQGLRRYSESDLKKAKLLVQLLEHGYSISALAGYSIKELEAISVLLNGNATDKEKFEHQTSTKKLLRYLADYKIDLVVTELQHLRMSMGAKEFVFKIVLPTLQEVGLMVSKDKYTVTQEHIISTIIRDQLSQIYLPNIGEPRLEVALATPEGNLHELAIIMADILCRANRFPTRYLGAAHPAECLAEAMSALKCPTLILGVISSDHWDYDKNIVAYLQKIDLFLKIKIKVILGGGRPLDLPTFENIEEVKFISSFHDFEEFLKESR